MLDAPASQIRDIILPDFSDMNCFKKIHFFIFDSIMRQAKSTLDESI